MAVSIPKRTGTGTGTSIRDYFGCEASLAVGDLVCLSETPFTVIKVVDNESPSPVMGVCFSKKSDTEAEIHLWGPIKWDALGLNLNPSKSVVVCPTGIPTSVYPSGLRQVLGLAMAADTLLFNPHLVRNRR